MTERADIVLLLFFWPLLLVDKALGISDGKGNGKGGGGEGDWGWSVD